MIENSKDSFIGHPQAKSPRDRPNRFEATPGSNLESTHGATKARRAHIFRRRMRGTSGIQLTTASRHQPTYHCWDDIFSKTFPELGVITDTIVSTPSDS